MAGHVYLVAAGLLILTGVAVAEVNESEEAVHSESRDAEIWMGGYRPESLEVEELDWSFVKQNLDVLELYINMIAYLTPEDHYGPLVEVCNAHNIPIAIQCGYFDWDSELEEFTAPNPKPISDRVRTRMEPGVGVETAREEIRKIAHLIEAGGTPAYIVMDGPVRRLMNPGADTGRTTPSGEDLEGFDSLDDALDEIIAYMRTWREAYPDVEFILLTNFPNWGWKGEMAYWGSGPDGMFWGDYYPVVKALLERTQAEGLKPAGLRADNPYDFLLGRKDLTGTPWPEPIKDPATVNWLDRLLELEALVREAGVQFDIIVNSDTGGGTSDELFYRETLEFIDVYQEAGGNADRYVFQSWYPHPEAMGPEDEPYTMTYLMRSAIQRLRGEHQETYRPAS